MDELIWRIINRRDEHFMDWNDVPLHTKRKREKIAEEDKNIMKTVKKIMQGIDDD